MNSSSVQEEKNRTTGLIASGVLHALMILLFFLPIWKVTQEVQSPPIVIEWGGGGDDAALGERDAGKNDKPASAGQQMEDPSQDEYVPDPAPTPPKPKQPARSTPVKSEPAKSTATTDDPNVAALKRAKEQAAKEEKERQQQQQENARKQAEAEKQAREQKAREEQARLEAERKQQEEYNKKKGKYGSGLGTSGSGQGSGSGGRAGNQGIEDGDPNGKNPLGNSPGSGGGSGGGSGTGTGPSVGGGLGGRKLKSSPKIYDNSQKTGTVVIEVCVDSDGNVIGDPKFTLKGSTTQDGELVDKAKNAARKTRFEPSSAEKQCGTLAYTFKLQ